MSNEFKERKLYILRLRIKNCTYYVFDDIINIKNIKIFYFLSRFL